MTFEKEGLPKGWSLLPFGNIKPSTERFDPTKEENRRYVGLEHIGKNTGKIIGSQESKMAVSSKTVFYRGDLLYGKLRPYLNKVAVADFDGVCSTDILVFQQNSFIVNTFLKLCLLKSDFVEFANSTVTGVQHPRTSHKKLSDYPIPLPPPSEQHRIVSKIESIFAQIDAVQENLERFALPCKSSSANLNILKNSILKNIFENIESKRNPLQKLSLKEICHKITDGTHKTPTYCNNGIHFLRVKDIHNSEIDWSTVKQISHNEHLELIRRCKPEKDDVLFSKNGTIGLSKVIDWNEEFSIFVSLALFKPKKEIINSYFLKYFLDSPTAIKQIAQRSKTVTVTNLHLEEIRKILISLPPLNEQKRIVTKIESIFGNIDTLNLFCFILRGNLFTNLRYFMILYMLHLMSEQ